MRFLRPLLVSFGTLTLLTGLAYPAALTLAARILFPQSSQGSPLVVGGQVRGSRLIAQATEDPRYFWCRPSPTGGFSTNAAASGGSTLAGSGPAFREALDKRIAALRAANPDNPAPIPQDLVTASASGLDPHLSPEGALWQVPRIAKARGLVPGDLEALVRRHIEGGSAAPARVNVLELNGALDGLAGK